MSLRPLGNRIIVRPEPAETESAGGIIFPQSYGKPPAMSGTVMALGQGPAYLQRIHAWACDEVHRERAKAVKACIDIVREFDETFRHPPVTQCVLEEMGRYLAGLKRPTPPVIAHEVEVGDYVAFSFTAGQQMTVDGSELIVMAEDDVQAVWKPESQESAA